MFNLIRRSRAIRLHSIVEEERDFYAKARSASEIRACQLETFNEVWSAITENVPFYATLVRERKLPPSFISWETFRGSVPISDRAFVQKQRDQLVDHRRPTDFTRTTGGSTSEPVHLPSWRSELASANADVWLARSWFGIDPSDKLFLIWGHSHQLGRGIRGRINAHVREMKDALLGYCRWSAYDLSEMAMRRAGEALLKFRPDWVMAYSVALDQLARVNVERAPEFAALNLKAAIASAESFPRSDSTEIVARVLGCPVAMEYGAVESGPVAHQRNSDGRFQIFWRHWFVEGEPSPNVPGTFEIFLTSLYPRKFPLVRYRIGDLISDNPNAPDFDQTFSRVIGRCNDYIELADGTKIHSEAFTHAVKECDGVGQFQVLQSSDGKISFRYVSVTNGATIQTEICRRLALVHLELQGVEFEKVASLPKTISGKTRTIIRKNADE